MPFHPCPGKKKAVSRRPSCPQLPPLWQLRSGLGNRILLQSDLSVSEQSAVYYCAGPHSNLLCAQYDSIECSKGSERGTGNAANLPENIRGFGATGKHYLDTGRNAATGRDIEISRYLEDPDIICAARERDVGIYRYIGAP